MIDDCQNGSQWWKAIFKDMGGELWGIYSIIRVLSVFTNRSFVKKITALIVKSTCADALIPKQPTITMV